jgi:hypothetical protein
VVAIAVHDEMAGIEVRAATATGIADPDMRATGIVDRGMRLIGANTTTATETGFSATRVMRKSGPAGTAIVATATFAAGPRGSSAS